MARIEQNNGKRAGKKVTQREQPQPQWQFNMGWILVPLVLLGMAYILTNARSSIAWEGVMDFIGVSKNRAAYTRLFHLCLVLTFIIAAVRILGRKNRK